MSSSTTHVSMRISDVKGEEDDFIAFDLLSESAATGLESLVEIYFPNLTTSQDGASPSIQIPVDKFIDSMESFILMLKRLCPEYV